MDPVRGVDHLDLVVTDLERSLEFYNELLRPLGFTRNSEITGEQGERVIYIGGTGPLRPLRRRSPSRRLLRRQPRRRRRTTRTGSSSRSCIACIGRLDPP